MIITDRSKLEVISRETSIEECEKLRVFEILEQELRNSSTPGSGLVLIQLDMPLRASIIKIKDNIIRMINPVIIEHLEPFIYPNEGCLSCPGKTYSTDRYRQITVKWLDYDSKEEKNAVFYDYESVVLQHEIDHHNGILNYKREHRYVKIGRNEPCPLCQIEGTSIKWKKCKKHNKEVV